MAHEVEFTKVDKINEVEFKKGDTVSVSDSIYKELLKNKSIKEVKQKKGK